MTKSPLAAALFNRAGALALVVAATMSTATPGSAQATRYIRGIVTDSMGHPLENAEVRILELGRLTHTDLTGNFYLPSLSPKVVDLSVRRIGYQLKVVRVSLANGEGDSLRVYMAPDAYFLPRVDIVATADAPHPFFSEYEKRRATGIGTFLTQRDFERHNSSYPSDAFRALPGMRLVRTVNGQGVRFMSSVGMRGRGECVPMIWVDGQRAPGMEIDDLRAADLYGVEIYRGVSTTPPQFATPGVTQCGTIVVWTRRKAK